MPFYYHVSYHSFSRGVEGWGSAAVTWDQPLTTSKAVEDLRRALETKDGLVRDSAVIIAIWPLLDEGGAS